MGSLRQLSLLAGFMLIALPAWGDNLTTLPSSGSGSLTTPGASGPSVTP